MSSALDMSLDDLIKDNKQPAGKSRSGARGGGARRTAGARTSSGPIRRNAARSRPSPYSFSKPSDGAPDGKWQHDLFEEGASVPPLRPNTGIETGTKLFISNLDFGVSNDDIKELFSELGDLKRSSIHYDRSGRSKGTGEVVYSRRADAETALKRYNNVQLDGKPMKIEIIGTNLAIPAAPVRATNARGQATKETRSSGGGGGGGVGSSTRGRGRARGGGRGRGGRGSAKSAADLDAELDDYHSEAMQVS